MVINLIVILVIVHVLVLVLVLLRVHVLVLLHILLRVNVEKQEEKEKPTKKILVNRCNPQTKGKK
jgi:hypothetical protein